MYFIIIFIYLSVNQVRTMETTGTNLSTGEKVNEEFNKIGEEINEEFNKIGKEINEEFNKIGKKVNEEFSKIKTAVLDVCKCSSYTCGCCAHLEERDIHLNSTICANISYLVHDYGISITITLNQHTLFNQTISARNPPPMCIGLPIVKEFTSACISIYDINATTNFLHACVRVEARVKVVLIAKYDFGCFNIGSLGSEGKHYEASNAAIMSAVDAQNKQVKLLKDETSKESNANMVVTVVGITIGLIVMTFIIIGIIAMAHKRGNASSKGLLFKNHHNYGSLVSVLDGGNTIC